MDLSTWTAKEDSPLIRCFRRGFSSDEEDLIIRLYCLLGNRWSLIAGRVPGRTDKQIEKYWHSTLSRKFAMKRLIRPRTHRLLSLHMKRFRHNEKEQHSAFMAPKFNQEQNLLLGSVDNAVPSSEGNTINAETKVLHSVPQADPCQKMVGLKPSMEEISTVDTTSITKDLGLRFHTMQMQCKIEDSCSGTWGRY